MENLKEGLIEICLFMIGGHFILLLQSGKRYYKITQIVLELSCISLFIILLFSNWEAGNIEEYWNTLEQTTKDMENDVFDEKSLCFHEIEKDGDAFQALLMDSAENELAVEIKSKINNSEIGGDYTVKQVFLEDELLNVTLVPKENSEKMDEMIEKKEMESGDETEMDRKNIVSIEKVIVDVNFICQKQKSVSDKEKSQLEEDIAKVLEMDRRNLEVTLQ